MLNLKNAIFSWGCSFFIFFILYMDCIVDFRTSFSFLVLVAPGCTFIPTSVANLRFLLRKQQNSLALGILIEVFANTCAIKMSEYAAA